VAHAGAAALVAAAGGLHGISSFTHIVLLFL
jgi:hypothetical protein